MFRRLPLTHCVLWLVVLLFWTSIASQYELRQLAQRQFRRVFVPPLATYSFRSLNKPIISASDSDQAAQRILWATDQNPNARSLLDQFPTETALLAAYVINNRDLQTTLSELKGPMFSGFPHWSVRIKIDSLPSGLLQPTPEPAEPPSARTARINDLLRLIDRGRKLEPQNTFWDWMYMAALLPIEREREIPAVLRQTRHKTVWDDHTTDIMAARSLSNQDGLAYNIPAAKIMGFSGTPLPHLTRGHNVARMAAQIIMGLRLQDRNDEALTVGKDALHLARLMRLRGSFTITSMVGTACERIIFREADVSFFWGTRRKTTSTTSARTLASVPSSLLFLAHKISPKESRTLDTEWTNLQKWDATLQAPPAHELLGGLITRKTIENAGWTTRATSYLLASLPIALFLWLVLWLFSLRFRSQEIISVASYRGAALGLGLLAVLMACDWITRTMALRESEPCLTSASMCDANYTIPEELLFGQGFFFSLTPSIGQLVVLWLGMIAFIVAFKQKNSKTAQSKATTHEVAHPLDWVWKGVKWVWRSSGKLLSVLSPLLILGGAIAILCAPTTSTDSFWNPITLFCFALSLCVWPLAVVIRHLVVFWRTRQRTAAPLLFLVFWRSLLSGYVLATLLVLPVLLFAQSRFELDFNHEFAPIERGHMVRAIQQKRGLPIQ